MSGSSKSHRRRKAAQRSLPKARGAGFGIERLEQRRYLADSAGGLADIAAVNTSVEPAMLQWRGKEYFAFRDSYVVKMPQTNLSTSAGDWDYESSTPVVPPGWIAESLGGGFFKVSTPGGSIAAVDAWAKDSGVLDIAPNIAMEKQATPPQKFPYPVDPYFQKYQWGLHNEGTVAGQPPPEGPLFPRKQDADIDAPEAWNMDGNTWTGSKAIIVAVMDDGIDHRHPDLAENLWTRDSAINADTGLPVSIPASVTGILGWDSAERDADDTINKIYSTTPRSPNDSHGTHVAGIIGARPGNLRGISGVNWDVKLYSAKIFRDGGRWADGAAFLDAVNRIVTLKTRYGQAFVAANASFYSYGNDGLVQEGVRRLNNAGIMLIAAAGNGYDPCLMDGVGDLNDGSPECHDLPVYPANLPFNNVISVGSSTARDTLSRFSNWGQTVDIAAPGENIWSTVNTLASEQTMGVFNQYASHEPYDAPGERYMYYRTVGTDLIPFKDAVTGKENLLGGYASMSGTSMSAAYVTGTVALASAFYYQVTGALPSVTFLRNAILNGADAIATLTYTEKSGTPGMTDPDYHQDLQGGQGEPTRPGMFNPPTVSDHDPGRVHSVAGNRRLNAFGTMKWCRDNLPPSIFVTSVSRLEGDVGTTAFRLRAQLLDNRNQPVVANVPLQVLYWTEDIAGGALNGVDYVGIPAVSPRSFTIAAGQSEQFFTVEAIGDTLPERDESFRVRFRMPLGNSASWVRSKFAACTITDDDPTDAKPLVRFPLGSTGHPAWMEVAEPVAEMRTVFVPVELDRTAKRDVEVFYETRTPGAADEDDIQPYEPGLATYTSQGAKPADDYLAQRRSIVIPAGQRTAVIPVRVNADSLVESKEFFSVRLQRPSASVLKDASRVQVIAIGDGTNPPPEKPPEVLPQIIIDAPSSAVVEGSDAVFTVRLVDAFGSFNLPAAARLAVQFAIVNGTARVGYDFVEPTVPRIVIGSGQSAGVFRVRTISDRVEDSGEQFAVQVIKAVYIRPDGTRVTLNVPPLRATATIVDASFSSLAAAASGSVGSDLSSKKVKSVPRLV